MRAGPDVFDRDLDPQPRRPARGNDVSLVPFQRLVVNPFLAVLLFVIVVALWNVAFARRSPGLFQLGVGLVLVAFFSSSTTAWIAARPAGCSATAATRASGGRALAARRTAPIPRARRAAAALGGSSCWLGVFARPCLVDRQLTPAFQMPCAAPVILYSPDRLFTTSSADGKIDGLIQREQGEG